MNILISSAGRRVSLVRAFQKELQNVSKKSKVYAADSDTELSAACHVADDFFGVPRVDDAKYLATLVKSCKARDITLIIPTIDTELELLAENKKLLAEYGITILVSSMELIKICRDKRKTHSFFRKRKIKVAKEYTKEDYKLPLFIKPYDGSRCVDTFLIKSKNDLTDYHLQNDKLMFLEYLDHEKFDEYTCDLYYGKDNILKTVVPRKRLEVRDGEVYKALTSNNSLVKYISKRLNKIDGAVGCLTLQFFMNKDNPKDIYAIEINPRFGGGYPLSYLAGANFPKWIIDEYLLNKTIPESFDVWEDELLMIRYDHEILVHGYKG